MVSGTATGSSTSTPGSSEENSPPIYRELLNEMDDGTRAVVESVGTESVGTDPESTPAGETGPSPQHRLPAEPPAEPPAEGGPAQGA